MEEEKKRSRRKATNQSRRLRLQRSPQQSGADDETTRETKRGGIEEGELTRHKRRAQKEEREVEAKQKAEYEARGEKTGEKDGGEQAVYRNAGGEKRGGKFNGPLSSDAEKQRVRECGAAAQFGVSEHLERNRLQNLQKKGSPRRKETTRGRTRGEEKNLNGTIRRRVEARHPAGE